MKRFGLYLLIAVFFCLSGQTSMVSADGAPPQQTEDVKAATVDVPPLHTDSVSVLQEGVKVQGWQGEMESDPIASDFEFIAVGVTWSDPLPIGSTPLLSARVSDDGTNWGEWVAFTIEEDQPDNTAISGTDLLFAQGKVVQLRAAIQGVGDTPFTWAGLQVTFIDGRGGPTALELAEIRAQNDAPGLAPTVITRAQWGANESYRFDSNGNEKWEREYYSLRAMFVHHTVTGVNNTDPAAIVRAIYYYHAITQGWGDIGYHYLVDQYGNIYQGRYGTEVNGLVVKGGHALGYNNNTMGISLIGDFTNQSPPSAQVAGLEEMLTARAATYGINPFAPVFLDGEGSGNPDRTFTYSVLGHRDSHIPSRTTCPGDYLYAQLGTIRTYVRDHVSADAPTVNLVSPRDGDVLTGNVEIRSDATPNVERIEYFLDGSYIGSATTAPWAIEVESASLPSGNFTLKAKAITGAGLTDTDERTVLVAEAAPEPSPNTRPPDAGYDLFLPLLYRGVAAPVCQELIANGNFSDNTHWMMLLSDYAARYVTERRVSNPRSLRAGMAPGDNYAGYSSARIPFTVPDNATSVTLTFQYMPKSGSNAGDDGQYIGILNATQQYTQSIIPYGLKDNRDSWLPITFDLAAYKGQTIYLYIGAKNDGAGGGTTLYVDDVSVQACMP